jgi:hypothetical protein
MHGGVSPEAMHEHLVQQGFDPVTAAEAVVVWQSLASPAVASPADAHDPSRFRLDLDLPDDPRAMSLDELDRLIAYHDSLGERFDQALARLAEVSAQIEAAMREHGSEVAGDLRRTDTAPLLEAWSEGFAECDWCHREIEAIGAYAEPLAEDDAGDETSPPAP